MGATPAANKYQQVAAELTRRITAGHYPSGELPSTATLASEFRVATKTIQRALAALDGAGLTVGRQGRQRFVIDGNESVAASLYEQIAADILRDIKSGHPPAGGRIPSEADLVIKYGASRATVRKALEILESGHHVARRAGRRYVAGANGASDLAYERVSQRLRDAIQSGAFPSGQLPAENRLAEEQGVSRPTIRQALSVLEADGLIRATPKQGWFITDQTAARKEQ